MMGGMTTRAVAAPPPVTALPLWPAAAFVLVWSSGYIAGPLGVEAVSPFWVVTLRFALAAALLYPPAGSAAAGWSSRAGTWCGCRRPVW